MPLPSTFFGPAPLRHHRAVLMCKIVLLGDQQAGAPLHVLYEKEGISPPQVPSLYHVLIKYIREHGTTIHSFVHAHGLSN
jgi:hypothetical protein